MMKTTITITLAIITISLFSGKVAEAQHSPLQQLEMMQAQLTARTNQLQNNIMRSQQQREMALRNMVMQNIARYRKESSDYRTSDQQVWAMLVQKFQRENPKAAAAMHRKRMEEKKRLFNRRQATHRETTSAINKTNQRTYNIKNASSNRIQRKSVDMIHGRGYYRNPNTGQVIKLPNHSPNTYYHNSNGTYYQAPNGHYYHHQNGYRTQLDPYNN